MPLVLDKYLNWIGDYQFTLTTPTLGLSFDWASLEQHAACLCLQENTYFHGVIVLVQCFSNENSAFFLKISLASPLLKLHTQQKNQYFSGVPISQVIRLLFADANMSVDQLVFQLAAQEPRREFILQHQETDWQCFKRLVAEQGWYVILENTKETYRIVIRDVLSAQGSVVSVEILSKKALIAPEDIPNKKVATATLIGYQHDLAIKTFKVDRFSDLHPNQNLSAECVVEGAGIGRWYCFGGFFESNQQAQQVATILQQASTCCSERVIIELEWSLIDLGSTVNVQSSAHSWLVGSYQVIAMSLLWKEAQYFTDSMQKVRLVLIKRSVVYRNPLALVKPMDLIAATVIGSPEELQLKKVGRYRVQLDNYHLKTSCHPAVRMLYPLSGDGRGFHFSVTAGTRVRIGFLYHQINEPIILGAVTSVDNIVTRANQNSYRLKTALGFEWQIQESEGCHENALFAPDQSAGFILKQGQEDSGIWFWSQGSKTIQAKGAIHMVSDAEHRQTHHQLQVKTLSEHQVQAQKTVTLRANIAHHHAQTMRITAKEMRLVGETWRVSAKNIHFSSQLAVKQLIQNHASLISETGMHIAGAQGVVFKVGNAELSICADGFKLRAPKIVLNARTILTGALNYA